MKKYSFVITVSDPEKPRDENFVAKIDATTTLEVIIKMLCELGVKYE